ncbi:hypothetical protein [Maribacter sp.]|uniref:hypothetical protein n=1 Tax=Maribacter sp. TaxID=1897614 RepID=UPI0025C39EC3|nr:hypothetical protein [Maribacter sp.]
MTDSLPYEKIPEVATEYTAETIVSRMVDGLFKDSKDISKHKIVFERKMELKNFLFRIGLVGL